MGHPLIDAIAKLKPNFRTKDVFLKENGLGEKPLIAVLPGSRVQEIERMLDIMLAVAADFADHQFVVAGSTSLPKSHYASLNKQGIKVIYNQTYELMNYAQAGIIKSGTSTLESALFKLPQVVCYKTGALSFAIGKQLVKIKYISLVNLIMDKHIVKELIQNEFTSKNIALELNKLLKDQSYRNTMIEEYNELIKHLGGTGASSRIAQHLVADASGKK